jgi:hypothetical protein
MEVKDDPTAPAYEEDAGMIVTQSFFGSSTPSPPFSPRATKKSPLPSSAWLLVVFVSIAFGALITFLILHISGN